MLDCSVVIVPRIEADAADTLSRSVARVKGLHA